MADYSMDINTITTLNLGSGKDWREDCFNVDILPRTNPDWVYDICKPIDFPRLVPTKRFGELIFMPEQFQTIIANDVLEHLPNLVTAMTNCLALLKVGGEMKIYVPYDLSYGAWQDPTHVRGFNERSWLYYTEWYWYLGWTTERFEKINLDWKLSEYGINLLEKGTPFDDDFLKIPRAIDGMYVILRKQYTT